MTAFLISHGFAVAFVAALAVRIYLLATHGAIVNDGIVYVEWAERVSSGDWAAAFNTCVFNLFPVLISVVHRCLNLVMPVSFEAAALALNLVCGMALLYPLYMLAKRYFGPVPALVTAAYLAIQPELSEMTCDVLREPSYLCAIAWSIYLFITAVKFPSPSGWSLTRIALSGAPLFFAALIRLEALAWFACFAIALFAARTVRCRSYLFRDRVKALCVLFGAIVVLAAPAAGYVRLRTGKWHMARLDKITAQWSLGRIRTKSADPLKDLTDKLDASMYRPDGSADPDIGVCVRYIKMAKTHRWIIYGSEVLAALWKAFHGVAAIAFVAGVWLVIRRRLLAWDDPLSVSSLAAVAFFGGIFMLYVSGGKYYLGTRHAMTLALPASIFVGVPVLWAMRVGARGRVATQTQTGLKNVRGTLIAIIVLAGAGFLLYKTLQPIRAKKLPMKRCGEILAKTLPPDAVLLSAASVRPVAYYAGAEFKPVSSLSVERARRFLSAKPRRYLLINEAKSWQVDYLLQLTSSVTRVDVALPDTRRYRFSLYARTEDR